MGCLYHICDLEFSTDKAEPSKSILMTYTVQTPGKHLPTCFFLYFFLPMYTLRRQPCHIAIMDYETANIRENSAEIIKYLNSKGP